MGKKIHIFLFLLLGIFFFSGLAYATPEISCPACSTNSCSCSVSNCNSGIFRVYSTSGCSGVPTYQFTFSAGTVAWAPSQTTYYLKVFCDDNSQSVCKEQVISGGTSSTSTTSATTSTTTTIPTTSTTIATTTTSSAGIACNPCVVGNCVCSVSGYSSGLLNVYSNSNCAGVPSYRYVFSSNSLTWSPSNKGTHYLKAFYDDRTTSSCTSVLVGGTDTTSTTTIPSCSISYGTVSSEYSIEYGNYKIYATQGVNNLAATISIKDSGGNVVETGPINQGDSYDFPISQLKISVIKVYATSDGTVVGVELTVTQKGCIVCTDSDGGINYYEKGTVTKGSISKTDECGYCTGACIRGQECPPVQCGAVKEYYCSGNDIAETNYYVCPQGCVDGACLKGPTYKIQFSAGWNMFSFPIKPNYVYTESHLVSTNTVSALTNTASVDSASVESSSQTEQLPACDSGSILSRIWHYSNGKYQEATTFNAGEGYWVKMKYACVVYFEGQYYSPVTIDDFPKMDAGWNQIGAPAEILQFSSIIGDCNVVRGPLAYNVATKQYEASEYLNPGQGYWLNVQDSCRLGVETPPLPPTLGSLLGNVLGHIVRVGG
jgi:hypothetical protein